MLRFARNDEVSRVTDVTIRRALLSVSDKDGLAELGRTLADAFVIR